MDFLTIKEQRAVERLLLPSALLVHYFSIALVDSFLQPSALISAPLQCNLGDPEWARTTNLQLRRLTLYPIELRSRISVWIVAFSWWTVKLFMLIQPSLGKARNLHHLHSYAIMRGVGNGPLAQLAEQLTLNQLVLGSSPRGPTTDTNTRNGPLH